MRINVPSTSTMMDTSRAWFVYAGKIKVRYFLNRPRISISIDGLQAEVELGTSQIIIVNATHHDWDSSVTIQTRLWAGWQMSCGSLPASRKRVFSVKCPYQLMVCPAFCSVSNGGRFAGSEAARVDLYFHCLICLPGNWCYLLGCDAWCQHK